MTYSVIWLYNCCFGFVFGWWCQGETIRKLLWGCYWGSHVYVCRMKRRRRSKKKIVIKSPQKERRKISLRKRSVLPVSPYIITISISSFRASIVLPGWCDQLNSEILPNALPYPFQRYGPPLKFLSPRQLKAASHKLLINCFPLDLPMLPFKEGSMEPLYLFLLYHLIVHSGHLNCVLNNFSP